MDFSLKHVRLLITRYWFMAVRLPFVIYLGLVLIILLMSIRDVSGMYIFFLYKYKKGGEK
jgi:hypothetical protein